jgi:TRAF-type zinc finger
MTEKRKYNDLLEPQKNESKTERNELPKTMSSQLDRAVTFAETIHQRYHCPFCNCVADSPQSCGSKVGCVGIFCKTCLDESLSRSPTCPLCRNSVVDGGARSLVVWDIIQSHQVYCCNYSDTCSSDIILCSDEIEESNKKSKKESESGACDWVGKYEELERHLHVCGFEKVKCPNRNCNKMILRRELDSHQKSCPCRVVNCPACHRELALYTLDSHLETCGKVSVTCSCGQDLLREDEDRHRSDSCPLTVVSCPFHLHGCRALVVRRDLDQHNSEWAQKHVELFSEKLQSLESSVSGFTTMFFEKIQSLESTVTVSIGNVSTLESKWANSVVRECSWTIDDVNRRIAKKRKAVVSSNTFSVQEHRLLMQAKFEGKVLSVFLHKESSEDSDNDEVCIGGSTISLKSPPSASSNILADETSTYLPGDILSSKCGRGWPEFVIDVTPYIYEDKITLKANIFLKNEVVLKTR